MVRKGRKTVETKNNGKQKDKGGNRKEESRVKLLQISDFWGFFPKEALSVSSKNQR